MAGCARTAGTEISCQCTRKARMKRTSKNASTPSEKHRIERRSVDCVCRFREIRVVYMANITDQVASSHHPPRVHSSIRSAAGSVK